MIHLLHKYDCCGCHACMQVCPKQCILMHADVEGFLYPEVDANVCIECGLCEKVCPMLNRGVPRRPLEVYAVKCADEVRMVSSSGGLFTRLAEQVIAAGGVVFGAKYSAEWIVVHDYTETLEGFAAFRGSKYVQSIVGDTYRQAESFLKAGRRVLYSGTPCQIAALKHFLRKEYDNLLTVDVVCHGVPSPLVWQEYLKSIVSLEENIRFVNMRDKRKGWSSYCINVRTDRRDICVPALKCVYIEGFLRDLYLRPSCYACLFKAGSSGSDVTLGDFWGVAKFHSEFADEKGVSLALVWSERGAEVVHSSKSVVTESTYENAKAFNPSIECSTSEPKMRGLFWKMFEQDGAKAIEAVCRKMRPALFLRMLTKVKSIIRQMIYSK